MENELPDYRADFAAVVEHERGMVVVGEAFVRLKAAYTAGLSSKKVKYTQANVAELFPSDLRAIRDLHTALAAEVAQIPAESEGETRAQQVARLVQALVGVYDARLDLMLEVYTGLYWTVFAALYHAEHDMPVLPKRVKVDPQGATLAAVYLAYIEYVPALFQRLVVFIRHLSGNDPCWGRAYDFVTALKYVDATLREIREDYPNVVKVMNLRRHFECPDLFPTDRILLREFHVYVVGYCVELAHEDDGVRNWEPQQRIDNVRAEGYCFVFEDMLVICTVKAPVLQLQYFLNDVVFGLDDKTVGSVREETPQKRETADIEFECKEDRYGWEDLVVREQEACATKRLIGKDLTTYMKDNTAEEGRLIPRAIEKCLFFLEDKALHEPNVFRRRADGRVINKIIPLMNIGKDFVVDSPTTASEIVKIYLRNLPNPLLTFKLLPTFIGLATEENLDGIKQTLSLLPLNNKALLSRLLKLCYSMVLASETTQVDSLVLAKILAPNLCWAQNDGISGNIYTLVNLLISHYATLFDETNSVLQSLEQNEQLSENERAYQAIKENLRQEMIAEENAHQHPSK